MGIRMSAAGFTIVEVIVTLTLASLFVAFFVQMFESIAAQQFSSARQASAHNIAFSNLGKFPDANAVRGVLGGSFPCNSTNNLREGDVPGTVLISNSSPRRETNTQGLPNPIQEVRAYYPLGCTNSLIKIQSKVSYGFTDTQGEAIYATYIR